MSFSAHADAVGILQLIDYCRPKNAVILVHGDATVMDSMQNHIKEQFNVDCLCPGNGEMITINTSSTDIPINVPTKLLTHAIRSGCKKLNGLILVESDELIFKESCQDIDLKPIFIETEIYLSSKHVKYNISKDIKISELKQSKDNEDIVKNFIGYINTYIYEKYSKNGLFPQIINSNTILYGSININIQKLNESEYKIQERLDMSEKLIKDMIIKIGWNLTDDNIANEIIDFMKLTIPKNFKM